MLLRLPAAAHCALASPSPPPRRSGAELGTEAVLRVTDAAQEFTFEDVPEAPVPSLLRGFSGAHSCSLARGACMWGAPAVWPIRPPHQLPRTRLCVLLSALCCLQRPCT